MLGCRFNLDFGMRFLCASYGIGLVSTTLGDAVVRGVGVTSSVQSEVLPQIVLRVPAIG